MVDSSWPGDGTTKKEGPVLNEILPSTRATGRWGLPILILSAFGAACATGPDFVRPEPPVAPSWTDLTYGESQVVRGEPANYGSWWCALAERAQHPDG